jgi:hypothetical protein
MERTHYRKPPINAGITSAIGNERMTGNDMPAKMVVVI